MFFPKDTLVIGEVKNGFVLRWKGPREEQEDELDGIFVFPDIGAMCDWLKETFPGETKKVVLNDVRKGEPGHCTQCGSDRFCCPSTSAGVCLGPTTCVVCGLLMEKD